MNAKTLKILAVVTLLVVLAAVAVQRLSGGGAAPEPLPEGVLPALAERINEVASIEVAGGSETVTLARRDGAWVVESKAGYPAKFETVKQALVALSELTPRERKTSDPARYGRLGLEDPSEGSDAVRVVLRDASGTDVGGAVLGDEVSEGGASMRYVRAVGDDQAWLAEGRVTVPTDPLQWIDRDILRIARDRVTRVTITHPDGEVVSIVREQGGTNYTLESVPEGRAPKPAGEIGAPASALSYLRLDDVRDVAESGLELGEPTTALYETTSGLKITVRSWEADGTVWASISAEAPPEAAAAPGTPAGQDAAPPEQAGDSGSDAAPAEPAEDGDATRTEAAEINAKVSGWLYAIPDYQATSLRKRTADLTEEPQAPEEAAPEDDSGEALPPPFLPAGDRDDGDGGGQ